MVVGTCNLHWWCSSHVNLPIYLCAQAHMGMHCNLHCVRYIYIYKEELKIRFSRGARGEKPENDCLPFWFYGESIRNFVFSNTATIQHCTQLVGMSLTVRIAVEARQRRAASASIYIKRSWKRLSANSSHARNKIATKLTQCFGTPTVGVDMHKYASAEERAAKTRKWLPAILDIRRKHTEVRGRFANCYCGSTSLKCHCGNAIYGAP